MTGHGQSSKGKNGQSRRPNPRVTHFPVSVIGGNEHQDEEAPLRRTAPLHHQSGHTHSPASLSATSGEKMNQLADFENRKSLNRAITRWSMTRSPDPPIAQSLRMTVQRAGRRRARVNQQSKGSIANRKSKMTRRPNLLRDAPKGDDKWRVTRKGKTQGRKGGQSRRPNPRVTHYPTSVIGSVR